MNPPQEKSIFYSALNGPFAAGQPRGTKTPFWRATIALGQDKQRAHIM